MNENYRNGIADYGGGLILYLGLVDEGGDELTGGDYERKPVAWTEATDGLIRPLQDTIFEVPEKTIVGGWRGYSAAAGGTDYGGEDVDQEYFNKPGQYKLLADGTGIKHLSDGLAGAEGGGE